MADLNGMVIDVTVIQGQDLVAKDKSVFSRKKNNSDPYVKLFWGGALKCYGR